MTDGGSAHVTHAHVTVPFGYVCTLQIVLITYSIPHGETSNRVIEYEYRDSIDQFLQLPLI